MTNEELQKILDNHKLWLSDFNQGERANLQEAYLQEANLQGANLEGAILRETILQGANLREAKLQGANLWEAKLQGANLWEAKLYKANLRDANLFKANLQGANLYKTNLQGANLGEAYLQGANLCEANLQGANLQHTEVLNFTLGIHFGFAHFGKQYKDGSYVKIGCHGGSLEHWLENYEIIGKDNGYTKQQIKIYGLQLKVLNKMKSLLKSDCP